MSIIKWFDNLCGECYDANLNDCKEILQCYINNLIAMKSRDIAYFLLNKRQYKTLVITLNKKLCKNCKKIPDET